MEQKQSNGDARLSMAPGLTVRMSSGATEDVLKLLNNTLLGSPGGLRYQLRHIPERISEYPEIYFASLYRNRTILGTLALCRRKIRTAGGGLTDALFVRYFTFSAPLRAKNGKLAAKRKRKAKSTFESSIKDKIIELFLNPALMELPGLDKDSKAILYAFVEPGNERSRRVVEQAGFKAIRHFDTLVFSRFSPMSDKNAGPILEEEKEGFDKQLRDFYSDHAFYFEDELRLRDNYYVLRSGKEIIAGVRAIPSGFLLSKMPGLSGWIITHFFPRLPFVSRLFSHGLFRFLALDSVYCKPGNEEKIPGLLEAVCALRGYHAGILWMDSKSSLCSVLRKKGDFGFLSKIIKEKPAGVYTNFFNPEDQDVHYCMEHPAFISAFDSV
jgi:hypothetical protein